MIEEEAAFEEMEQNMELATVHDERELRRKRREEKIEADLLAAKIEAEKKRIDAEKNGMERHKLRSYACAAFQRMTSLECKAHRYK